MFPIFRKAGLFNLVSMPNFQHSILFRSLEDYRNRVETDFFRIHWFNDFVDTKRIALLRGEIMDNMISNVEAERLLQMFLSHYLEKGLYERSVYKFNHNPDNFDIDEYLENLLMTFYGIGTEENAEEM
jgi:hypothetical protein